jgi:hypothetical protein
MIKTITERSLHEVLTKMRAEGVTLKDTEGFGINIDQSGHVYVVYMGEESETGVIDTSAGEAGVSGWVNSTGLASAHSSYIEIGEIKTSVGYGAEVLTLSSGTSWTATLAGNSNDGYIKPRTFFVEATDNAPELTDNGLGRVVTNDHAQRKIGDINYETGAVTVSYVGLGASPLTAPRVKYDHSVLPNSSIFPKLVALSHIVFITSSTDPVSYSLYNNNPANTQDSIYDAPVFFNSGLTPATYGGSTDNVVEDFCDSRISLCLNTDSTDRKKRWMKVSMGSGYIKAVYVYWNRLST